MVHIYGQACRALLVERVGVFLLANETCIPLPGHRNLPSQGKHHLAHHVVGRVRHHAHASISHSAPATHPASACGKGAAVAGQPGGLPAFPAGRTVSAALHKALAITGGAKGLTALAAAVVGSAAIGAVVLPAAFPEASGGAASAVEQTIASEHEPDSGLNAPVLRPAMPQPRPPASPVSGPQQPIVEETPPGSVLPPISVTPTPTPARAPEPASAVLFGVAVIAAWLAQRQAARRPLRLTPPSGAPRCCPR